MVNWDENWNQFSDESNGTSVKSMLQATRACSKDSTCKKFIKIRIGTKTAFYTCVPSSGVNIDASEIKIFVKGIIV